jgi:predicted transcriptional regulator of viral defense system
MAQLTVQKTASLMTLARKGPLRARDLAAASIPRTYLKRLCERGSLEKIGRGLYRLSDSPVTELSSLAEVAKRVPHGVICLVSALQLHGLTTESPHAVWLLIDRQARMPKLDQPEVEVVRASGAAREHGIATRKIDGVRVQITTPAKTVADCFRFRRHVGLDVAIAALKQYLQKRRGIDALVEAARADRVYPFMRPYLEALA